MMNLPCIGLFGTCGGSRWRDSFVQLYEGKGIRYFNPQVEEWTPEFAEIEAEHLRRDEIILFPITGETYGSGSLAETGFSLLQAVCANTNRWVVVMIEMEMDDRLMRDEVAYRESMRARHLVAAHLRANPLPNVFVVDNLNQMRGLSVDLYELARGLAGIEHKYGRAA